MSKIKVSPVLVSGEDSSWLADSCLLAVSSHGLFVCVHSEQEQERILVSFPLHVRTPVLLD